MSGLVHCIYTSVQTSTLAPEAIDGLVEHSRRKNVERGITGVLLHMGGTFFQVLEGPRAEIDQLYQKILDDPRHRQISQIIFEPIAKRSFGEFALSLAVLSPREFALAFDGASPEDAERLLAGVDEGRAKRILRAFGEGRWRARLEAGLLTREAVL